MTITHAIHPSRGRTARMQAILRAEMDQGLQIRVLVSDERSEKRWRAFFEENNYKLYEIIRPKPSSFASMWIDEDAFKGPGYQWVEKEFVR